MMAFAGLAVGLLIVSSIFVGLRLVALHRRTGGAPELMLGLMLLLSVGVGYTCSITAQRVGEPAIGRSLNIVSAIAVNAGFSLLFLFAARVFRPESAWARTLSWGGVVVLTAAGIWRCWDAYHDIRIGPGDAIGGIVQMIPIIGAYVWVACESLRYYGMMRRRLRLGMGDPAVCDRFLLCGAMALCATSGITLNIVAIGFGVDTYNDAGVLVASSVSGLGQAVLMVLAFAPPRSYLSWVQGRARAVAAA